VKKREVILPDGRHLIFYTFPEQDPPQEKPKEEADEETESAEDDRG
jgi:hypothetical protein